MQRNWRSLIQPKRIEIDETTHTRFYGEFSCQPLERGFGTTLGNALRRILLVFDSGGGDRFRQI